MKSTSFFLISLIALVGLLVPASFTLASIDAPRGLVVDGGVDPYSLRISWINPNSVELDHINIYFSNFSSTNPNTADGPPLDEYGLAGTVTGNQVMPNTKGEYLLTNLVDQRGTTNYYYFYITAVDNAGTASAPTSVLKRQTGISQDLTSTEEPTNFRATTTASSSISLAWSNPPQDDLYRVALYRATTSTFIDQAENLVAHETVLPSSTGNWTDTGLAASTAYYYKLITEDTVGNFSDGTTIFATTTAAPVITPPTTEEEVTPPVRDTVLPNILPDPNLFDYRAEWVGQSGTVNPAGTAHVVTASRGDTINLSVTLKNTGSAWWYFDTADNAHEVKLGTWQAADRISSFQNSSWLSSNRVSALTQIVPTGATATFEFTLAVPTTIATGTYTEYFRPVSEYVEWFGPSGIFWELIVI